MYLSRVNNESNAVNSDGSFRDVRGHNAFAHSFRGNIKHLEKRKYDERNIYQKRGWLNRVGRWVMGRGTG